MPTYKNIKVKKKGGGHRMQRVQVLKSGKYKFVKNTGGAKRAKKTTNRKTKSKKRTVRKTTKKGKKSGGRKHTIYKMVKGAFYAGAIALPGIMAYTNLRRSETPINALYHAFTRYLGLNKAGEFDISILAKTWTPAAVVSVGDFVASRTGATQRAANAINGLF